MPNMRRVIIRVEGGVATLVQKPAGVIVELKDYDTDGGNEDTKKDKRGDIYRYSIWGRDEVI